MTEVIGVRFREAGKIYNFDVNGFDINIGDKVIVETIRGIEFGTVVTGPKEEDKSSDRPDLKPVIRIADKDDKRIYEENKKKAKDAFDICQIKIKEHGLDMKLIDAEYTFDTYKLIFSFSSDGRIDFRDLVRDLAQCFKTRIELRQIGVRDQAKVYGGLGACGQECCCSRFLGEFSPVSIKMAKEQGLSLNPTKISGICGRLMCCLNYEQEGYLDSKKRMPNIGEFVETPDGKGEVVDRNLIAYTVDVKFAGDSQDNPEIRKYKEADLKLKKNSCSSCDKKVCPKNK